MFLVKVELTSCLADSLRFYIAYLEEAWLLPIPILFSGSYYYQISLRMDIPVCFAHGCVYIRCVVNVVERMDG